MAFSVFRKPHAAAAEEIAGIFKKWRGEIDRTIASIERLAQLDLSPEQGQEIIEFAKVIRTTAAEREKSPTPANQLEAVERKAKGEN